MVHQRRLSLVFMVLSLCSTGALGRNQSEPATKSSAQYTAPVPKREYLLNGLQLVVLEKRDSDRVKVHLRINSGAVFDLTGRGGLADITAGMLLRGGGGLTSQNVSDTVNQLQLEVSVNTSWDSIDITMAGPAESLEPLIDLLSRLVITPRFDPKDLQQVKASRIAEIKAASSNDTEVARRKAVEAVFGSHPFGKPMRGTVESISQIVPADLSYYHSRFFAANNAVLFVSGKATTEEVLKLGKGKFGIWKKAEKVPATFRSPENMISRRVFIIDRPGIAVATAAAGKIGFSRRADDYYASAVMLEMLRNVISKAGAWGAIEVSAQITFQPSFLAGPLLFEMQCPVESLAPALERLTAVLGRFRQGEFSAQEVEDAKQAIVARFGQLVGTAEGSEELILDIETYGLGRDYMIRFAEWVAAVTSGEVKNTSQRYLDLNSLNIVVAAPVDKVEPSLKRFGAISVVK